MHDPLQSLMQISVERISFGRKSAFAHGRLQGRGGQVRFDKADMGQRFAMLADCRVRPLSTGIGDTA